ncbi:hypothetical protein KIN20_021855 [Parelaphostrongylus tenuis]|uniref:Uncharacterized protein n=1 Tax=Parelaphostrongylus tenuis TaxID=148309 RepID=A0AAD5N5M9_PARTN|nr:hypothetical protein KIN20_021855 [Parelaphostrongylus tenuis]
MHLIESKDHNVDFEGHPLSSPIIDLHVETTPRTLSKEMPVHGEHLVYASADDNMHIVESKSYDIEFERPSLSSPTKTERQLFEDVGSIDDHAGIAPMTDHEIAAHGEHLVHTALKADDEIHIVESKDYDLELQRFSLLSPTSSKQNIHEDENLMAKYEGIPVVESDDFVVDHKERTALTISWTESCWK